MFIIKIVAIIPARGGSKRLPRKNIKMMNGKPMIAYSIEAAKQSKYIDRVIVSTDDDEIADVSREYGAEVMMRPSELAQDDTASMPVFKHIHENLMSEIYVTDAYVILQPTSPLRTVKDVDNAIGIFIENDCYSVIGVCLNPHPAEWLYSIKDGFMVSTSKNCGVRSQDAEKLYLLNGAMFVVRPDAIGSGVMINESSKPYIMPQERSIDIDTFLDFKTAEELMRLHSDEE
ncbi:MAG: acylneuraminate cytidylyltransferase family protein [Candidatus Aenigmarchaeota archaeon]|nr:acylneuraminate cytidylyltransferase family protein [Candidatus Aenigmarchaeota archaeon]